MSQTNICEITSAGLFIGVLQLPSNQIVTNAPTIPENHQARWNGKSWEYIAAVKNVCQLDKLNCFIGITTADLDLLEPETTYLLPAGCIDAEPPTVKDGFVAMWESGARTSPPPWKGAASEEVAMRNCVVFLQSATSYLVPCYIRVLLFRKG